MAPSTITAHGPNESNMHTAASTGAVAKLISEELETALSPLSSSTLTITSLGSTLGLANAGSNKHGSHIRGYDAGGNGSSTEGGSSNTSVRSARSVSSPVMASPEAMCAVGADDDASNHHSALAHSPLSAPQNMHASSSLPMAETASPASSRIMPVVDNVGPKASMRSISVDYTHAYASPIQPPLALSSTRQGPSSSASLEVQAAASTKGESASSPTEQRSFFAQRVLSPLAKKKSAVLSMAIDRKSISVSASQKKRKKAQKKSADTDANSASKNKRKTADVSPATATEEGNSSSSPSASSRPAHRSVPSKSLDLGRELLSQARGPFNRRAIQRSKRENAIYETSKDASGGAAIGPTRFQQLPRSLATRLGFTSTLASKARRLGDLRFVIAPHAMLPEIVEVIDCEEMVPVYRKISRSGKSWHESFHEVDEEAEDEMARYPWTHEDPNMMSEYEMAMALGLPYPGFAYNYGSVSSNSSSRPGSLRNSAMVNGALSTVAASRGIMASAQPGGGNLGASASYATFQSMADGSESGRSSSSSGGNLNRRHEMPVAALSSPSTLSFVNAGTVRMGRAQTSIGVFGAMPGTMSMYGGSTSYYAQNQQQQQQHPLLSPSMMQRGLLWEALTPYPNQFPLHIKDSRKVIDTASLASLVLDRHNFCYRFQLGSIRMRWTAKRVKKSQLALECYVRNALVAEIFVDYEKGYSPYNMPSSRKRSTGKQIDSGISTPYSRTDSNNYMYNTTGGMASEAAVDGDESPSATMTEDGTFPIMTILSSAFTHLAALEEDVVESFIVFSGIQVLEFLHL
ncbi:hypothetical protein LPJ81_003608 [Coemansia sp. IMI 209127]|nr:hypothetical protein LPJ81_003608 [Coemansia sp. IMI 209127]